MGVQVSDQLARVQEQINSGNVFPDGSVVDHCNFEAGPGGLAVVEVRVRMPDCHARLVGVDHAAPEEPVTNTVAQPAQEAMTVERLEQAMESVQEAALHAGGALEQYTHALNVPDLLGHFIPSRTPYRMIDYFFNPIRRREDDDGQT